jgi:Lon protease-like protein
MPQRLPLFPLDIVLFPGTPLPLHIFEPRYRTMLADCLEGDERFGVLLISPEGGTPRLGSVGCTARIHASELMPDGRSNIVVVGEKRFVVDAYLDESVPYAVGLVSEFDDDEEPGVSPEHLTELASLSRQYIDTLHTLNDSPGGSINFPDNPQDFSFQVAATLQVDTEIKQRLLSTRSTRERIRLLLRLLPPMVHDLTARAGIHEHARTNGKSDHHSFADDTS